MPILQPKNRLEQQPATTTIILLETKTKPKAIQKKKRLYFALE